MIRKTKKNKIIKWLEKQKKTIEIGRTLKIVKLNFIMESKLCELGWLNTSKLMYEIIILIKIKKLKNA